MATKDYSPGDVVFALKPATLGNQNLNRNKIKISENYKSGRKFLQLNYKYEITKAVNQQNLVKYNKPFIFQFDVLVTLTPKLHF